MRRTIVAVNAHPDDEALLMAGTLAKAAAAGHRVVLVVATDGELGLTSTELGLGSGASLGARRLAELQASADALGAARVVHLGYADSGMGPEFSPDPPGRARFVSADPAEAAQRVADVLRAEQADVVIGYDANGGYGHRDHLRLHEVVRSAARDAGTPRLLEATIPQDLIARTVELVAKVYRFPPDFDPTSFRRAFSPAAEITHRIDVRRFAAAKRASMAAHASQAAADDGDRTLAALLRLPAPLFALVFGREWYVDATGLAVGESPAGRRQAARSAAGIARHDEPRGEPGDAPLAARFRRGSGRAGTLHPDIFAGLPEAFGADPGAAWKSR